jgi:hypothetical protein
MQIDVETVPPVSGSETWILRIRRNGEALADIHIGDLRDGISSIGIIPIVPVIESCLILREPQ